MDTVADSIGWLFGSCIRATAQVQPAAVEAIRDPQSTTVLHTHVLYELDQYQKYERFRRELQDIRDRTHEANERKKKHSALVIGST